MSNEDDVFLKTFTEMIDLLKTIHLTIDSLKKSVEIIQLSIDGLGTGLTNANNNLVEMNKKFGDFSNQLEGITSQKQTIVEKVVEKPKSKPKSTTTKPAKKPKAVAKAEEPIMPQSGEAEHPIFIDLTNNINSAETFKSVGELLIEALEQIESNFSFSRVFYEIRRIGNSLIRKGEKEITANDKMEFLEKLVDWEKRLIE